MPDRHAFPVAMDTDGRLFVNHRLCYAPDLGLLQGEAEKVGARWLRQDPDGWFDIGLPAITAKAGDADALKGSGLRKVRLFAPSVDGRLASEDAVDFNWCEDWELHVDHLWPGHKYCGTIKGGSKRFKIIVGCQYGHGGEISWDFGNHSDQGNGYTTQGELTTITEDHTPVTVRYLSADPVRLGPHSQMFEVTSLNQGWFYPLFNFLKDVLRLFGVKI